MQEEEHFERTDRYAVLADTWCRERGLEGVKRRGVRPNPRKYPGDGEHQFLVHSALGTLQIYSKRKKKRRKRKKSLFIRSLLRFRPSAPLSSSSIRADVQGLSLRRGPGIPLMTRKQGHLSVHHR